MEEINQSYFDALLSSPQSIDHPFIVIENKEVAGELVITNTNCTIRFHQTEFHESLVIRNLVNAKISLIFFHCKFRKNVQMYNSNIESLAFYFCEADHALMDTVTIALQGLVVNGSTFRNFAILGVKIANINLEQNRDSSFVIARSAVDSFLIENNLNNFRLTYGGEGISASSMRAIRIIFNPHSVAIFRFLMCQLDSLP
jgi:hypothetical protein